MRTGSNVCRFKLVQHAHFLAFDVHGNWPNKATTASTFNLNYVNTVIEFGFDEDHSTSLIRVVL